MARLKLIAVFVMLTLGSSLLAPAAIATGPQGPLSCTTSSNSATSSDSTMGVKATAGSCPNGTNSATVSWDATSGGKYYANNQVGTDGCGNAIYASSALNYMFASADYGSGTCYYTGIDQNYRFSYGYSTSPPSGSGGVLVEITAWSGNCVQGSSSCLASTSVS